jgi:hypothetical protein
MDYAHYLHGQSMILMRYGARVIMEILYLENNGQDHDEIQSQGMTGIIDTSSVRRNRCLIEERMRSRFN